MSHQLFASKLLQQRRSVSPTGLQSVSPATPTYNAVRPPKLSGAPSAECGYCRLSVQTHLAQCDDCGKWFCNAAGHCSRSHIVLHQTRAGHRRIAVKPMPEAPPRKLSCLQCGEDDSRKLIFARTHAKSRLQTLCAGCHHELQTAEWHRVVDDQMTTISPCLIEVPSSEMQLACTEIKESVINRLEKNARKEKIKKQKATTSTTAEITGTRQATAASPSRQAPAKQIPRPGQKQLRFDSPDEYAGYFLPMIEAEADDDKKRVEAMTQFVRNVGWTLQGNRWCASVVLPEYQAKGLDLGQGDDIKLCYQADDGNVHSLSASVVRAPSHASQPVFLQRLPDQVAPPIERERVWKFEVHWDGKLFERMGTSFTMFKDNKHLFAPSIFELLLGHPTGPEILSAERPRTATAPSIPQLNPYQEEAVFTAIRQSYTLIQEPPGTGKTTTAAAIAYHMARNALGRRRQQILICASSNVAIDELAARVQKTGLQIIRIVSTRHRTDEDPLRESRLDWLLAHAPELILFEERKKEGRLLPTEEDHYRRKRRALERNFLARADAICTTCSGAGKKKIRSLGIGCIIIDEAAHATEPEILMSIAGGIRQLVLIGDHRQMGPVVMSQKAVKLGMSHSMFQRLVDIGVEPVLLAIQFRMHAALSMFPSQEFYDGKIENGTDDSERRLEKHQWASASPIMFWNHAEPEERQGLSYANVGEAQHVKQYIDIMLSAGVRAADIGVVTPYTAQKLELLQKMQGYPELEIESVDAYQGREKEIIIFSSVRNNATGQLGFLTDYRRLNVAITRAKRGLLIVGSASTLDNDPVWQRLLLYCQAQNALLEGPLTDLKLCPQLPEPNTN